MDPFERRVKSAAVAGWWTLLIAAAFLVVPWIAYLVAMNTRPAWVLSMWGPDVTWEFVQHVWFWMVAIFKLCVCVLALVVVWLTLWARQLRTRASSS